MDDWKRMALYLAAVLAALHCRPGNSQCTETFDVNMPVNNRLVEGGVQTCFRCLFDGAVDTGTTWRIRNDNGLLVSIDSSDGQVNGGVLTIFDPITIVPNTGFQNQRTLQCDRSERFQQYLIFVRRRGLVPPVVVGTTVNNESDNFSLTCDTSGSDPVESVYWSVNGSRVTNELSSHIQIPVADTLRFTNILRNYSGEYNCTVEDDRNDTISSGVNIVIQFEPDVTTSVMSPHLSPVSDTLSLSCNYNAIPPPNITWLHEGSPLNPIDPRITIISTTSHSDLMRDDLGPGEGGTYTCDASNVVGSSSVDIEVTVQVPPDPPTNVMVTSNSETMLGLSWINGFNGNSAITGVRVDYTPDGGSTMNESFSGGASRQSATLSTLLPFRNYNIRVHVENAIGISGPGSTVGATLSLRLPAPNVTLGTPNSTAVAVEWQPPTFDPMTTDTISSWEIEYMVVNGIGMMQTVSDPSTTSLTLTAEKGTQYRVRVAGVNVRGRGEWSPLSLIETPVDPPTMPRNLMVAGTGAFALNIEWDAPSDSGGRPVVNYTIEIREIVANGTPAAFTFLTTVTDPMQFHYEVRNNPIFLLSENTTYEVRVTAANGVAGQGPSSTTVGRTQPIGEPQRIFTPPGTVNITNTSVTVTWEFPGGYVDLYNIQYKLNNVEWNSSTDVLNITVMGFRNQTTIFGLMPATMYNIRIRTLNVNGESEWSPEANFITLPNVNIVGPSSVTTMAGEQVVITCNVSPGVNITWSRQDNQPLPNPPEGNTLRIPSPQPEDSGVYECLAGGVAALFTLMVEPPPTTGQITPATTPTTTPPTATPGGIGTVVIIAVSVGGGAALFIFLFVVVLAVVCLCRWKSQKSNTGIYSVKNRKLTWIETSNPNQFVPSTRPGASNSEETPAFDIPEDYQSHSSFNTLEKQNRIRRSRSPEDQTVGRDIAYTQLDHQQPVVSVHDAAPPRNVKHSNLTSSYEIASPTSFQYIPQDPSASEWPDSQAPHYANTVV